MNQTISFIGGDYRNIKLAQMMKCDNYKIKTYGMEKCDEILEDDKYEDLENCIKDSKIIISSIPFSKNGITIYMPFSDEILEIEKFKKYIENKKIFAGNINKHISSNVGVDDHGDPKNEINNTIIYDLMENEPLTIANAITTAEGAIQIAMEETKITMHNAKILILGFGRIGKILSKDLQGLGAKVTCEARKESDLTWIKTYGYDSLDLKQLDERLSEFDIIFNTIPSMILDKCKLQKTNKNCLIIDLASKPGGVDFNECSRLGINAKWALALPGKVAPITSAKWIKQYIYNMINLN